MPPATATLSRRCGQIPDPNRYVVPELSPQHNARNLRADQVDIPREYPRPAAASSAGSGQTATSSLSCCQNLPAGRNVVPAPLPQRTDRNPEPANLTLRAGQQQQSG